MTAITVQLDDAERRALEARADRKGITPEQEVISLIHEAMKSDHVVDEARPQMGLGTALAEIWGGLDLPDDFEFEELRFSGFDEDPFGTGKK